MRTKSDSAYKVYSNRQTLRDCFMLRVLYTGKTKKNERLLKTKQCSANSLPLQTAASHCFNVTFRFLSLSKHTEQSPESIPQCLSIGKFSVLSDFCSLERRTLLEKQTHRMFYRMTSISQTCQYLIKFSVEDYPFSVNRKQKI